MSDGEANDTELIHSIIARHFKIYDSKTDQNCILLYVDTKDKDLVSNYFYEVQTDLKSKGYIATIDYVGGEFVIAVFRKPIVKKSKGVWVNKVLLIVTFITTTIAGMYLWSNYNPVSGMWTLNTVIMGAATFAVPLMCILGIHELGHYYAAKKHGLNASLPYFIPSIPPFGTFGAFISLREPMPNRKALVDIGAAGPMCGFLVTIPIAILGLYLTEQGGIMAGSESAGMAYIMLEPIYSFMVYCYPVTEGLILHPMAFAGWVGFFVTGINLLPIGQLDGGHIARGLLGDNAKWLSFGAFIVLIACVFLYDGWLLFAFLILLIGIGHPPPLDNLSKIDRKTTVFGAITLLLILITFVPQPISIVDADYSFEVEDLVLDENVASFTLTNTGNASYNLTMSIADSRCTQTYYVDGVEIKNEMVSLKQGEEKTVIVTIYPSEGAEGEVSLLLSSEGHYKIIKMPIS